MKGCYASVSTNGSTTSLVLSHKESGKELETLPIVQASEQHRSYIISTWVKSYETFNRRIDVCGMRIPSEVYRTGESKAAELLWSKSHVVTGDDGFTIHAWICGSQGKLWHVYVPPPLRCIGVARGLVEQYCGATYLVPKPWPTVPKGHHVSYSPYLYGDV